MKILDYLMDHFLILDGGTGTVLQAAGLQSGERPETWNLTHPDRITGLCAAYYAAGSNVVSTNTFGVNLFTYSESEAAAIIEAAVSCVKTARDACTDHPAFVAFDLGPTGRLPEPFGDVPFEKMVENYAFLTRAAVRHGVDLILIETMNDARETRAALIAAKENSDLPVFVSNAYSKNDRLMSGGSPAAMALMLEGLGADAVGVNCSMGPEGLAPVVREYLGAASVPVLMKANAGLPRVENGHTVFDIGPEQFADAEAALAAEGVRILGGCCGTTPEHIRALCGRLAEMTPLPLRTRTETLVSSSSRVVSFSDRPLLIGERINPTGKKRLKQALLEGDTAYVLEQAALQEEKGVHLLDVNTGLPGLDEGATLSAVVRELQAVTELPLQLDSSDPAAMEKALRVYCGRALINSVNGKQESMDAIFPLVRKYGGTVIALTLDESGIPETSDGRIAIAKKIVTEAAKYGIPPRDLVFDPLAMAVSAAPDAATVTLETLERIRKELGCHTSLGISNVSFGLPARDAVNAAFFSSAMERGLSAAIMNPFSDAVMNAWRAYRLLHAMDANCADWTAHASAVSSPAPAVASEPTLRRAVVRGFRQQAADLTESLLASSVDPMTVIQEEIIPALNEVGEGFEKQTVFLPQLLMSAEAASAAFGVVRNASAGSSGAHAHAGKVVLATVKGDVHDIGKNIVRLLLENYGFEVLDLGKDVAPETVLEAAKSENVRLVGLSALMTTTVPAMEDTVRLLHRQLPEVRVVVGGAVLTADYAKTIGADFYAADAMETVRIAESVYTE